MAQKKTGVKHYKKASLLSLCQSLCFDRRDLTITRSLFGMRLSLRDCKIDGEPGSPALPLRTVRIALPKGAVFHKCTIKIKDSVVVLRNREPLACVQQPQLALASDIAGSVKPRTFIQPDIKLYQQAGLGKNKVCRVICTELIGLIPCVYIELSPVRFTKEGFVDLVTGLELTLHYTTSTEAAQLSGASLKELSPKMIYRMYNDLASSVLNPEIVNIELRSARVKLFNALRKNREASVKERKKTFTAAITPPASCDYLIITDNNRWDPVAIEPLDWAGDLEGTFYRLANWKKNRGLRTHVTRIKSIVDGLYGVDFKTDARDLQEVIRNFLKWFCGKRGVEWVLIGGDESIIPSRRAAGVAWGQIPVGTCAELNQSEWRETFLGMHVEYTDKSQHLGDKSHTLTNYASGTIIPFDNTGSSDQNTAGWYHTTDSTFATRSTARTEWIRVNGPASLTNAHLVWYTPENLIPTDLYYASLYDKTLYNKPGKHDWDTLDNGLYGQHTWQHNLDGVSMHADVIVGRAPVESVDEVNTFIDKVLEYEKWCTVQPSPPDDRFKYMLFVSSNWGHYFRIIKDTTTAPPLDKNWYQSHGEYSLIHCTSLPPDAGDRLICYFDDTHYIRLQYDESAGHGNPGWFYAKSDSDLAPSFTEYTTFPNIVHHYPLPTPWIVVYDGDSSVLNPMYFALDYETTDSSMTDQEELRRYIQNQYYGIDHVERLYTDEPDLDPSSYQDAPIKHLTRANLEEAMNRGPHLVSVSGHGNPNGTCYLKTDLIPNLTNNSNTSIIFVDSCLTASFDNSDSAGEYALSNKNGGAVAYIGNTRFSWVGLGAEFRLAFFQKMQQTRHLGELNDSKFWFVNNATGWAKEARWWTIFTQHLLGDPEMPVYRNLEEADNYYIGSRSYELHDCRCQWADKIGVNHGFYFKTLQEGLAAGYDGCGFCLRKYHTK